MARKTPAWRSLSDGAPSAPPGKGVSTIVSDPGLDLGRVT
jgi:hypothetical protein